VNDPTHQHGLGTLTHVDSGHTHSTPIHVHSGILTHSVSGDLSHSPAACRNEFLNVMFIERLDNSA